MKRWLFLIVALIGFSQTLRAAGACCTVTAMDARTGTATAVETATGQTFEFHVPNPKLFATLRVGTPVYANFSTKQVSLDGKTPCGVITQINPAPARGGISAVPKVAPPASPAPSAAPPAPAPAAAPGTMPPPAPSAQPPNSSVRPSEPTLLPGSASHQETLDKLTLQRLEPGKCIHSWLRPYGGILCRGKDASRPAILLFHGLHQSAESWTKPSSTGYYYDFRHAPPEMDLGKHSMPNAGLYKAGPSELLDVDPLNWLDYLVARGFTVATWSQRCCDFEQAYPSAKLALAQFASDVEVMYPTAPPPLALIGHSRGGLIIHKLLREQGSLGGRIHWVITLHSPHHGSLVAQTPEVLVNDTDKVFEDSNLPSEIKGPLHEAAIKLVSPIHQLIDEGSKELAPDSSLITGLLNGDAPVPGVQYYTFGGTNPTLARLYTWLFTPESAVPQYKKLEQYFHWKAKPVEVGLVSPLFDRARAVVPEVKAGAGDILVTDASARLPYSIHQTDDLNHAEVLWDRAVQHTVAAILSGGAPHILPPKH
jgi:hypothetical protein